MNISAHKLETELATRDSLGPLTLDALVSESAHAVVYRGRYNRERVAIKVYRPEVSTLHAARSVRERDAQSSVSHPCVARLLASGTTLSGSPYLVSEWVEGMSLEHRLDEIGGGDARNRLRWPTLHPILIALARGLGAIHAQNVIHRDVKPSNIILPSDTRVPSAVLLDFGHALALDETRLTDTGQVLGSAAYMAPEQAAGRVLDGRADLYALGVVLYRALTGSLPFEDASAAVVMGRHLSEAVVPPRERAPDANIPSAAEDLAMWLLAKDPAQRVPNARVLQHSLRAIARQSSRQRVQSL